MKINTLPMAALCGILSIFFSSASAQNSQQSIQPDSAPRINAVSAGKEKSPKPGAESSALEVESLKRRIEEVENQNRRLIEIVTELKARLDQSSVSEKDKNNSRTVVASSPARTTAEVSPRPAQANNDQPVRWSELIGEGNRIKLYGFLRLDLDFDSQRPNNTQTPFFITSPDPRRAEPTTAISPCTRASRASG